MDTYEYKSMNKNNPLRKCFVLWEGGKPLQVTDDLIAIYDSRYECVAMSEDTVTFGECKPTRDWSIPIKGSDFTLPLAIEFLQEMQRRSCEYQLYIKDTNTWGKPSCNVIPNFSHNNLYRLKPVSTKIVVILGEGPVCDTARRLFQNNRHFSSLEALEKCGEVFDLGISAWNKEILLPEHLALACEGWINTHPSLLPFGRGRDPYFWAIVNNEPFGATIHWMDKGVDTGDIILQEGIQVLLTDTSKTLRDKAIDTLQQLLSSVAYRYNITGKLPRLKQEGPSTTYTRQDMLAYREKFNRANITSFNTP